MDGRYKKTEEREAVEAVAARLYLEARNSDRPEHWDAIYRWIEQDPSHGVAFAKAEASWELTDRLRELPRASEPEEIAGPAGRFEAFFGSRAIAALLVAIVFGMAGTIALQKWAAVDRYRVGIGEVHSILLADGSRVHLNTDSVIEVTLRSHLRFVRLVRGEARFDVTPDPKRTFVVEAGDAEVRALGTVFTMRMHAELTELTVIQGRVSVRDGRAPAQLVPAGTAAAIRGGQVAVTPLDPGQIERRTAWSRGMIELSGDTIAQAVAEFNRYRTAPLVIGDPQIAALCIAGSFRTTAPDQFIHALEQQFGIRAVVGNDESVLLLPASGPQAILDSRSITKKFYDRHQFNAGPATFYFRGLARQPRRMV